MRSMSFTKLNRMEIVSFMLVMLTLCAVLIGSYLFPDIYIFRVKPTETIRVPLGQTQQDYVVAANNSKKFFLNNDSNRIRFTETSGFKSDQIKISGILETYPGIQEIEIYNNQLNEKGEFNKYIIYNDFIENITWESVKDNDVTIWYRNKPEQGDLFKKNLLQASEYAVTFIADFTPQVTFADYTPDTSKKEIYVPIRGDFQMYAYVGKNEEFYLKINKRDLNIYNGEDVLRVKIINNRKETVKEFIIADDGLTGTATLSAVLQTLEIREQLPEGIYQIDIDQADSIVESMETTLSRFVFGNSLFTANNSLYTTNVKQTVLYTASPEIKASLIHNLKEQYLVFNGGRVNLSQGSNPHSLKNPKATQDAFVFSEVIIPNGDIVLESSGYFSTSPKYYFNPEPIRVVPFESVKSDIKPNYVIARYNKLESLSSTKKKFSIDLPVFELTNEFQIIVNLKRQNKDSGVIIEDLTIER